MKNILILIPILLLLAGCSCDEEHPLLGGDELIIPDITIFGLRVMPEEDSLILTDNANEPLVFEIDFDLEVDPESLRIGDDNANIKILAEESGSYLPIEIDWVGDATFSLDLLAYYPLEFCSGGGPCTFRLIIGESILDYSGTKLDGDGDGRPGGHFVKDYTILVEYSPVPPLQIKLPGADTTFMGWPSDTNTVTLELEFSQPVDQEYFSVADMVHFLCPNGEPIGYILANSYWQPGTDNQLRVEVRPELAHEYCGLFTDINGNPAIMFQVVITDYVRSTEGAYLDGDYDGLEGGNCTKWYVISGGP